MLGPAPTVGVSVPPNRDYIFLLQQTTQVYNQLLHDKSDRLLTSLLQQKQQYDAECARLEARDKTKALEYGVKAQDAINKAQKEAEQELTDLHGDYQQKLGKMFQQLEDKWRQEHKWEWRRKQRETGAQMTDDTKQMKSIKHKYEWRQQFVGTRFVEQFGWVLPIG